MTKNNFPYEDIVHLPHHVSQKHPQMSRTDRAAQFSPFAALTGHSDAIAETARLTDVEAELSGEVLEGLNRRHQFLLEHIKEQSKVTLTYFVLDEHKNSGAYVTKTGQLKKINECDLTYGMIQIMLIENFLDRCFLSIGNIIAYYVPLFITIFSILLSLFF